MDDEKTIELLSKIATELEKNNQILCSLQNQILQSTSNMWKLLALTIIGAFAVIGVRLAFP